MNNPLIPLVKTDITTQAGFSQLFQQTHLQVYRYLYGLIGGAPEEVEDLVAESFARAWSGRYNFQGDFNGALYWLLKIAKNQMIDSYRRQKVSGESACLDDYDPPTPDAGPETQVLSSEQCQILWGLLRSLPEEQRETLVLRYFLDWSIGEIAIYMNKKETAVSMVIHRTLKRLQQNWPIKDLVFHIRSEHEI